MRWLLLAFLIIPAIEIGLFIWIGGMIGPLWVVVLIFLTGFAGVALARSQGIETWRRAQQQMNMGQVPTYEIVDGICIFVGGVLLFAPGFFTDTMGLLLVIPFTRRPIYQYLLRLLKRMAENRGGFYYRRW